MSAMASQPEVDDFADLDLPRQRSELSSWFRILLVVLALGVAGAYALPRYVEQMPRTKDAATVDRLESAALLAADLRSQARAWTGDRSAQMAAVLREAGIPAVGAPARVTVAAVIVNVRGGGVTLSLASPTGKRYQAFVNAGGDYSIADA